MELKYESIEPITIKLGDFLTSRNIAVEDLTEVIFIVKKHKADLDEDAVANLTMSGDGVTVNSATEIVVNFAYSDFGVGNIEAGNNYYMALGFKTITYTKYLEAKLNDERLYVTHDTIRA